MFPFHFSSFMLWRTAKYEYEDFMIWNLTKIINFVCCILNFKFYAHERHQTQSDVEQSTSLDLDVFDGPVEKKLCFWNFLDTWAFHLTFAWKLTRPERWVCRTQGSSKSTLVRSTCKTGMGCFWNAPKILLWISDLQNKSLRCQSSRTTESA